MKTLDVDAVAHDRDVAGRHARIRREDLVAGAIGNGEDGAVAPGRILAALDREQRALIRAQPAQARRTALLGDPALEVATMAAAARPEEVVADGASEADHRVGVERPPDAGSARRKREQL